MESVRKNLEEAKDGYTASKFRTNLDRKQRKVLADVLELVDETLRDNGCGKRKICLDAIKAAIRAKYQGGE
jgi:hypothetical protein